MLDFGRNPLLILHARSELRPARAAIVAAISLIVCFLIAMGCWSANPGNERGVWVDFYGWLLGAQFVWLGVWSAATCGQSSRTNASNSGAVRPVATAGGSWRLNTSARSFAIASASEGT